MPKAEGRRKKIHTAGKERNMAQYILIVEDDPAIAGALASFLAGKGCTVARCSNLQETRIQLDGPLPDAAVLDWNLPDGDGTSLCRELRAQYPALPILLLTVRSDTPDILKGFACGADDYVTKPFDREVLYSRLLALWRRSGQSDHSLLQCGGIFLDESRQTVTCRGEPVVLGALEYQLLCLLLQNKGRTMTRRQLLDALWDREGHFVNDNTLTVTMKRLREKLGRPACIKTVRSFGYRMEDMP